MSIKGTGLDQLQRDLAQASTAFASLDGEIATLQFDPADPSSVEVAIAEMEQAIDGRLASYQGNAIVANVASQLKEQYRSQLLDRVDEARAQEEGGSMKIDQSIFRQIENTVSDLRRAETNTFERHIKKFARLLHSPELEDVRRRLIIDVDLSAWLEAGEASQGGMVGSAKLEWPDETEHELGIIILLIESFAEDTNAAINFSFTFYYNGNTISHSLQKMVGQLLVPFSRDYIDFVKAITGASEATMLPARSEPAARKAFIVHGHDEGIREAVARFLERIGFEAIILHEQANQGRTIIEKIEAHGDVGFAIVLLTPDDVGAAKDNSLQPRARQNVLLELGYFIARLGRSRVCALKRGDIEIPSDFGGIVYETYDTGGGWKMALGRELQAAGFDIDWNNIHKL